MVDGHSNDSVVILHVPGEAQTCKIDEHLRRGKAELVMTDEMG